MPLHTAEKRKQRLTFQVRIELVDSIHRAALAGESLTQYAENGTLNSRHPVWDCTALSRAAVCGEKKAVKRLLEAGADIEAPGFFNLTPLEAATRHGRMSVVALLKAHGAKPANQTNIDACNKAVARDCTIS